MMIVWIPLGIALLVFLRLVLFRTFWDRNLSVHFSFDAHPVTEKESTFLEEVVSNRKRMALHLLQVQFQLDRGLHIVGDSNASISDRSNCVEYFSLRSCEQLTRRIEIVCARRGYYRILRTTLLAPDLLSSRQQIKYLPQDTSLYVYPRMLDAPDVSAAFEHLLGEILSKKYLYPDVFTFRGIREYAPTDPMSSINQKAAARCGHPMVNLRDYTAGQDICILLNLEEPAIRYDRELPEDGIRLAYSLAALLIEEKLPVSLRTNGRDLMAPTGGEASRHKGGADQPENGASVAAFSGEIALASGSSKEHLSSIAEGLARIDLEKPVREFHQIVREAALGEGESHVTYILISSARGDALIEAAGSLAERQGGLFWLAPLEQDMRDLPMPPAVSFLRIEHRYDG